MPFSEYNLNVKKSKFHLSILSVKNVCQDFTQQLWCLNPSNCGPQVLFLCLPLCQGVSEVLWIWTFPGLHWFIHVARILLIPMAFQLLVFFAEARPLHDGIKTFVLIRRKATKKLICFHQIAFSYEKRAKTLVRMIFLEFIR